MNPRISLLTAGRVLRQLRGDHRTVAMLLVVPVVLIGLLAWIYDNTPVFGLVGPALLGVFPFVVMFLVTSIAAYWLLRQGLRNCDNNLRSWYNANQGTKAAE